MAFNKAFPPPPSGDIEVEDPDGVARTFGENGYRHSLYDANYIPEPGFRPVGYAYGAFPYEGLDGPFMDGRPTMRKPVKGE